MSKLWSSLLVSVVAVLFVAGSALAAEGKKKGGKKGERKRPSAEQIFKRLDKNEDGKITVEELKENPRMKKRAEAIFKRMDADGNGEVTLDEFTAAMKKRMEHRKKHGHKKHDHKKGDHKKREKKEA